MFVDAAQDAVGAAAFGEAVVAQPTPASDSPFTSPTIRVALELHVLADHVSPAPSAPMCLPMQSSGNMGLGCTPRPPALASVWASLSKPTMHMDIGR